MKACLWCETPLKRSSPRANNHKFCNEVCRNKHYYRSANLNQKAKARKQEELKKNPASVQCLICGDWFIQVGTHISQEHKLTAREYREEFGLDVKRGLTKGWYKELKSEQVFETGNVENLKNGSKYRFTPGDTKAGKYERSKQTMERLKELYKYNRKQYDRLQRTAQV